MLIPTDIQTRLHLLETLCTRSRVSIVAKPTWPCIYPNRSMMYSLLAAKSSTFSGAGAAAAIVLHIVRESQMHVDYCAKWGVTPEELEITPELPATSAYARYIMDVGYQGDDFMLIIAVASCLLGYAEVGKILLARGANTEGNPYKR